ncbi:hypothetical protein RJ640_024689 [Escallonia rubra]|uniref:UBN2 domain-containing protein n=1 Tax=Escallonia rubra TaxID=112253 RepID=A0AA88RJ28_9ASTE|nr:hypothetical protein RJ640_024689 [Escallonia rubra]
MGYKVAYQTSDRNSLSVIFLTGNASSPSSRHINIISSKVLMDSHVLQEAIDLLGETTGFHQAAPRGEAKLNSKNATSINAIPHTLGRTSSSRKEEEYYEAFKMKKNESINEMYSIFTLIVTGLKLLGKVYPKNEMVRKVRRSLPKRWKAKVRAIQEAKHLNVLKLEELVGSLTTHKITMKIHDEEDTTSKNSNLALKVEASYELEENNDDSDNVMDLITRKFKKFPTN